MKALKYLIQIFSFLLIIGCSDDLGIEPITSEDGYLYFSVSLAEPQKIQTRAEKEDEVNERKINTLIILIFNEEGSLILKENITTKDFSDVDNNYKNTIKVNYGELKLSGAETVYIIANYECSELKVSTSKIYDLNQLTESSLTNENKTFVMSGKNEGLSKVALNNITLYRTAAKVSLKETSIGELSEIRNSANSGLLTAYYQSPSYINDQYTEKIIVADNVSYIYPTEEGEAFIILKASFPEESSNEYYYKVAFLDDENNPFEIKPNYWYEVEIKSVEGKGYSSADEAAKHEPSNLVVTIHDHAPEVYSMVSDGIRELGVKTPLTRSIATSTSTEDTEKDQLFIRLFSINESEYQDLNNENIQISTVPLSSSSLETGTLYIDYSDVKDWFSLEMENDNVKMEKGSINENNYADDIYDDNGVTVGKGVVLKLHPVFNSNNITDLNSVSGKLKIYWQGMEREIEVIWIRNFSADDISSVILKIHKDNNQMVTISDYWEFLAGNGFGTSEDGSITTPILYGLHDGDMSPTKVRNEGFHFPVMYGENTKWTYEYEITLMTDANNCNITCTSENSEFLNSIKINNTNMTNGSWSNIDLSNDKEFTLTSNYDSYDYATGELTVSIGEKSYTFDLYHTGFFHYDSDEKCIGKESPKSGYYYYEVIKLDGSNDEYTYWLDRNLGATAAGLYIQDGSGNSILGNEWPYTEGAQGGYYIFNDLSCPPGYRIPIKAEWDNIRLSSRFTNEERTSSTDGLTVEYYTSYFNPTDNEMVIFPKSRYYNNSQSTMMGDAFGGYYWSSTEDNPGWNKVLYLLGSSNYYGLGNINNYGMSVRCVADIKDNYEGKISTDNHTISFNVTGATHVYLYKYNSLGERVGLFAWPGKAIGNAMSMSVGGYPDMGNNLRHKVVNFSYTSSSKAEDLYVLFNFVTDEGLIWTYGTQAGFGVISDPSQAKGWKVINGGSYLFQFNIINLSGGTEDQHTYNPADTNYGGKQETYYNDATEGNKDPH